jgi:hypothetical protein
MKRPLQQLALPFSIDPESLETIFNSAHRELKPRTPLPKIKVAFFPFAGINHTARLNNGELNIRVSDLFDAAPPDVCQALAMILLGKLYRKKADPGYQRTYRRFVLSNEVQERARLARRHRGRRARVTPAQGRHFDLDSVFQTINARYFGGQLEKPCLSWSTKRSRHILGSYDATHQTIFISRLFDSARVPPFVVEYVMFHEMLHVRHHTRVRDCRLLVHTAEFRQDEKRFAQYAEAKDWLKQI